jgi:hypothetical protein
MPEWYALVRAARYLGVPAWELETRCVKWLHRALTAEHAETWARNQAEKNALRRAKQ